MCVYVCLVRFVYPTVCLFIYPSNLLCPLQFLLSNIFLRFSLLKIPITSCIYTVYTKHFVRSSKRAKARAHKSSNNKILIEVFETDSIYFDEFPRPCASQSAVLAMHVCVFLLFYLFIHVFYLLSPPCRENADRKLTLFSLPNYLTCARIHRIYIL